MAVRGGVQLGAASGTSMSLKKIAQRLPPRGLFICMGLYCFFFGGMLELYVGLWAEGP